MIKKIKIAAVLFEGYELLDYYGPLQMFGMLGNYYDIYQVAESTGLVMSSAGIKGVAEYSFDEPIQYDLVLVPGGNGTRQQVRKDAPVLSWLRSQQEKAQYITSVCTGAGILAATGLLDNRNATTNKAAFSWPQSQSSTTNWIEQARWVEDGKFITAAGVSAGMDMALRLIELTIGKDKALQTAKYAEYEWHNDSTWDPFSHAFGLVN
ncbi:DJ-1/PfpI family protein [Spartinivicinus ruber]|uniref:DJ-1/PfpI family protein n=1 Tax=Spartinivicinus ruber TaxID=2683272 RepID=UPI0013D2ED4F|nr:DJ-1/PfpI family protein [Spartinivicinus ruber]